jgi:SSS family solute:Na+ symporter
LILMVGALLCLVLLIMGLPGGASAGWDAAVAADKFSLGSFGASLGESTFWVVLAYGIVINLQNFGIDQNYVQRYVAARSETAARRSLWFGGMLYVPVSAKGLLLAAIFSAAMSTISTSLNSSATLLLTDWYLRFFRPQADERESMRVLHGATLVWGVLGTGVALAMIGVKAALDAWWTLSGIFAGGMLGLFLLGLISRRAGNAAAVTAVVAGVLVILWMTLTPGAAAWPEELQSPFHTFMTVVVGTLVVLLVGLGVTSLKRRRPFL